jgi:putative endonuclease
MYFLYILSCADTTFYIGITTDVERRLAEHNTSALGARYTRGRRPVTLVYSCSFLNRSLATQEEARLKKYTRKEKWALIQNNKNYDQK